MWKIILICGMFFALIAASAVSAQIPAQVQRQTRTPTPVHNSEPVQVTENDLRMARFFAGVALIRNAPSISDADMARSYRELEAVCGVTGKEALAFLKKCRGNPAEWKKINDLTIPLLTELSVMAPGGVAPIVSPWAANRKKGKL